MAEVAARVARARFCIARGAGFGVAIRTGSCGSDDCVLRGSGEGNRSRSTEKLGEVGDGRIVRTVYR